MRMITSEGNAFASGTIYDDCADFDQPTPTPTRLARGSSSPHSARFDQLAAKHHSDLMVGLAHEKIMIEIDRTIGCLTRADYDAMLGRVVQSIARRRMQRDNG